MEMLGWGGGGGDKWQCVIMAQGSTQSTMPHTSRMAPASVVSSSASLRNCVGDSRTGVWQFVQLMY
jgi:hypothetical protein